MTQWAAHSTGTRIKLLRGDMTQEQLADSSGLSVATVRKGEQNGNLGVASLLRLASGLSTDISVILGQQAPRRAMERDERAALRDMSAAVHDSALGIADVEPGAVPELRAAARRADAAFWTGGYTDLGAVLGLLLPQARATYDHADGAEKEKAAGVLADAYLTAGMAANLLGARDLGYSAITYGHQVAVGAGDVLRAAHLMAAHSWVCLRDGHTAKAVRLASMAAAQVEPRMSDTEPDQLSVYGQLVMNAAVAASRGGASPDAAREYLSQAHAVAARLGREHARGGHGQPYGPVYATTQALSVAIALGETGKAVRLINSAHLDAHALPLSTHARWKLDVALIRTETKEWEPAAAELSEVCEMAPRWVRHQALPGVIVERLTDVSVTKVRKLAEAAGVPIGLR
ncbi:helix-turn-helix domain-containing protein [Streptomyces lydicus]|uniref:helix-turn-helix domain-containing protein n=1 Tax=Streptomyces lydicus TaxID=47763 RepID=UPI001010E03C|nr:helix-turn-helix domain-containing protein [Streptomyces lydicus]MCZ1012248.1 helix-turn-helix domain-containing protein [Streptomyces lydicus]